MSQFKSRLLSVCVIIAAASSAPAFAQVVQTNGSAPPTVAPSSAPSPYQLNLLYSGEEWDNARGGLAPGSIYMNNLDAALMVDTDKAFGWTGGSFHLEGFYANSHSLNLQKMGAIDVSSAIDTTGPSMERLYQVYYDQNFAKSGTDVLFGIYDLATEFSTTKPEQLFVNKNFYWNTVLDQSGTMPENGVLGPGDYPYTPLALRVRQNLDSHWSVQGALADGAADDPNNYANNAIAFSEHFGVTGIGEVDYEPVKHTKLMAGMWGGTSYTPAYNQTNRDGTQKYTWGEEGGYIGGATRLYSATPLRGLDGFFTLGFSDPVTTNTDRSLNAGLTYTGLLDVRPEDKIGLGFETNHDPAPYMKSLLAQGGTVHSSEQTYEITYRAPVIKNWVTVQPDIQYVAHPGYNLKDDVVFGVHFEIGHLFDLKP